LFSSIYGELFEDRTMRSFSYVSENYAATQEELAALIGERIAFLAENPISVLRAEAEALQELLTEDSMTLFRARQELKTSEAYLAARPRASAPQASTFILSGGFDPNTLLGALAFGLSAGEYREIVSAQIQDLAQSIAGIRVQLAEKRQLLDVAEATLDEFDRRIQLLKSAHATLARNLQEAKIALAEAPDPIHVIDEPVDPRHPIAPRKTANIAIAGFLGLMLGTLLAFLVDYLARVREQEGVKEPPGSTTPTPGSGNTTNHKPDQEPQTGSEEDGQQTPS